VIDPRTPVLVGVGQLTVRDGEPLEPLGLMEAAARAAGQDAGTPALLEKLQSVAVVDAISQPLGDPGALLAERLGSQPAETVRSGLGGNGPQALVNDLCTRIARDGLDVALIAGAEAMATLTRLMKRGEQPPWPQSDERLASRVIDDGRDGSSDAENAAGLIAPIFLYPVFEHALRGAAGRTREEHLRAISELWAHFSGVAAGNPHAWSREARTADELATASDGNRRVSDPYLKLHNSHIGVDQGAALLLCSAEAADAAGVPREQWVFPWAGAQAHDHWFATERDELQNELGAKDREEQIERDRQQAEQSADAKARRQETAAEAEKRARETAAKTQEQQADKQRTAEEAEAARIETEARRAEARANALDPEEA